MLICIMGDLITGYKTFRLFHYTIAIKFGHHNTEIKSKLVPLKVVIK